MSGLPRGWAASRIGELCALVNGKAFKPTDWRDTGLPIIRIQNLNRPDASFNHFDGSVLEKFLVKNGDLLFAWSGTPGTSFGAHIWNGPDAILNQHIFNVRFDERLVDKAFFRYAINQTLEEQIAKAHGGVGLAHVTKGKFEETVIRLPPLPEQRRIVARIDSLSAKSSRARAHLDHIPRLVEKYKQAILAAAFAGDLSRAARERHGWPRWQRELAKDACAKVQSGGTPKDGFASEGVPFLKVYNIVDQVVSFDYRPQFVERSVHDGALKKSRALPGDVIMNIVGPPLGKVAIIPDAHAEWNLNQALTLFRPSAKISSKWIYRYLCSGQSVRSVINETKGSAGQVNISLSQCRDFSFPVPSPQEQDYVVRRIETAFTWINRLAAEATSARKLIAHLDQAILAKAFRGELVPQNPSDEPAPALVARIRAEREATARPRGAGRRS